MICDALFERIAACIVADANQQRGIVTVRPESNGVLPNLAFGDRVRILPNHAVQRLLSTAVGGGHLYISGQLPIRPDGTAWLNDSFRAQATQAIENMLAKDQVCGRPQRSPATSRSAFSCGPALSLSAPRVS